MKNVLKPLKTLLTLLHWNPLNTNPGSSLKCDRITIHKNLFISFIINNTMWILWYVFVINQTEVIGANKVKQKGLRNLKYPFEIEKSFSNLYKNIAIIKTALFSLVSFHPQLQCQALHVIVHYFMVCNYFWMFCEGLYLHTLLVVAFVSEETILKWFYFIGWLVPVPIAVVYAGFRGSSMEDTAFCWIEDSKYTWILNGPVCLSIMVSNGLEFSCSLLISAFS